jgi:hypothetical protein
VPEPGYSAARADPHPALRRLKAGALRRKNIEPFPSNRKQFSARTLVRMRRRMGGQKPGEIRLPSSRRGRFCAATVKALHNAG